MRVKPVVGDWVRVHRGGALHIGVVEYIRDNPVSLMGLRGADYVLTCGICKEDEILEIRRSPVIVE